MTKKKLDMNIQLGESGTTDYNKLKNLPSINGVELKGNVNSDDLNIDYEGLINKPKNLVQDPNYVHTDNNFTDSDKTKLDQLNVGTGNLLIKRNNELLGRFNANNLTDVEINVIVPVSSNDLNDSGDLVRQTEFTGLENEVNSLSNSLENVQQVIPNDASSNNKLTTESYVDNAVNNMLAYYITKNAQGDPFETKAELLSATVFYAGGQVRQLQRNDYCNVQHDESQTPDALGNYPTSRYLYQNGQWEFQFILNTTAFSNSQLAAINSGIDSNKVAQINTNANDINNLQSDINTQGTAISTLQTMAHTHSNKEVLDTITAQDINNWNNKLDSADLPYIINLMGGNS